MKHVLVCEDSFEGILSGIYEAWIIMNKEGKENVGVTCNDTQELNFFVQYETVNKNSEYAYKVANSIRRKISEKAYADVYRTAMSVHEDKADILFRYLQHGFKKGRNISECMAIPEVMEVTRLSKRVWREYDHFRGFLRFSERTKGLLFSEIAPENNILELLGNHFADRIPSENFVIRDMERDKVLVHRKFCDYYVVNGGFSENGSILEDSLVMSNDERYYENLWKIFFDAITIESRRNYNLQRNNLPLRYRKYMTEFKD